MTKRIPSKRSLAASALVPLIAAGLGYVFFRSAAGTLPPEVVAGVLLLWAAGTTAGLLRLVRRQGGDEARDDGAARAEEPGAQAITASVWPEILEAVMEGVIVTDAGGRVKWMNARAESLTGWPAPEAKGKLVDEVVCTESGGTGQPGKPAASASAVPSAGGTSRDDESQVFLQPRNGREHCVILRNIPVKSREGGQPQGTVVLLRDVTEERALRKRLEENRNFELVNQLARGVAHDFNNTLATIMGNVSIACAEIENTNSVRECLEETQLASRRAVDLVRKLALFCRGRMPAPREIEFKPVVEDVLHFIRPRVPRSAEVRFHDGGGEGRILADPTEAYQLVLNLVTNACQAIGEDAGHIDVLVEETVISAEQARAVAGLHPGRVVRLRVEDDGCGMAPENLERAFEPFFTTREPGASDGLGLSIVRRIAQSCGGAVAIASTPGQGTRVDVWFPAVQHSEPPPAPTPVVPTERRDPAQTRILFVDDDEPLVFLVKRMLRKRGYQIEGYTSAKEALDVLGTRRKSYDLIVTDQNMPEMPGIEFAAVAQEVCPRVPIVLASGYLSEEQREAAARAGIREVVFKPDTVDHLVDVIEKVLREL